MQKKLDQYFSVTLKYKPRSCFVYDPSGPSATFEDEPLATDRYLTTVLNVGLYVRNCTSATGAAATATATATAVIPSVSTSASISLLKSNLQKAVRRGQVALALQSALAVLERDPMELLRRLPILYIEDVCLMDSYPLLIWWMMAGKEYILTTLDKYYVLQCVLHLATEMRAYDATYRTKKGLDESWVKREATDAVLAVYYRSLYGGMKGDMRMLEGAVEYYLGQPEEILHVSFENPIDDAYWRDAFEILPQAVDFHPFPRLLTAIAKKTGMEEKIIQEFIWYVDSAINVRKQDTIDRSAEKAEQEEWRWIEPVLARIRHSMLQRW